ncbi:ABC transporter permease [Aeromicrobium sp. 9AM]|uniref:ABC transporter permease n=1 Tax=Aeromicrobium sp. 9AM TaxID=2653126 RepID=UPI0012F0AACE|nr:ABC transporter permease [Aeromicrobium sp. 9AM]VXC41310.1 Transport permease protein [Aeromicrobium sp. 9AM]
MSTPARTILRTESKLFLREPGSLFWIVAFPTLLVVILGSIPSFRDHSKDLGGARVIDLYIPISILLSAIMASIQSMPGVLAGYREQRVLRRVATTPARPAHLLAAQYVLHGAAVAMSAVLVLVVGRVVFDVRLPGSVGPYVLVLALALLACLAIGGVVGGLAPTARISSAIGTVVFFPMMFTAGLWAPVQTMPHGLRTVVELTPGGAAARGMDQAALGHWPAAQFLLVLVAWAVVAAGAAARYFRWE